MRLDRLILMTGALLGILAALCCGGGSQASSSTSTIAAPAAAFTVAPTTPLNGQAATFTDTSTGTPTSWAWTFGDGGTSTLQNPTHTYAMTGTYTVVLKATNAGGSNPASKDVTVASASSAPVASFTFAPTSPTAGQTVNFTDTSTNTPTSWSWTFGDGATSTVQNPTHAFTTAGTYTVTLSSTNATGSNQTSQSVTVAAAGPTSGSSSFIFSTLGQQVSFTDTSAQGPMTWSWTFGDGSTSTAPNPTHTYAAAGTYTVSLTVTYPSGAGSPASQSVTVTSAPLTAPLAAFTFNAASSVAGQVLPFADQSTNKPTAWAWKFGDGGTSTSQNPTHTYTSAGTYVVTLTASNANGSNSAIEPIMVAASAGTVPTASFNMSPATPTIGQIVAFTDASTGSPMSWSWSFGDGSNDGVSSSQNPTHVFTVAGTYTVSLTATNTSGASVASTKPVTVSAASAAPVAGFLVSPTAPSATQMTVLTDASTGGPTSWSWTFSDDNSTSTAQHPTHAFANAGTYKVTLIVTNAGGSNTSSQTVVVGAAPSPNTDPYNMSTAINDGAQQTTLAFDGLAMVTGNLQAQTFFPPGKVADYTGFQYLRDNTPNGLGHNTSFMTNLANNVLFILNDVQLAQLKTLAIAQQNDIDAYGYKRYPLMKAFRRMLDGDIPAGSTGLNLDSVKKASNDLYLVDGQISFDRAMLYSAIYASMANGTPCNSDPTTTQLAYLDKMKGGFSTWPVLTDAQLQSINDRMKGLTNGVVVAMMTYAGDIFSWYAGNVDADVYFCPERHGTYYGGFYIKDGPAIGVPGYQISTSLTATAGKALSDPSAGYVTASQAAIMNTLAGLQRNNLYAGSSNIVQIRTEIATLLRSLRSASTNSDLVRARVLQLSGIYGELDGENNYYYATVFAQVYNTLTDSQKTSLAALRKSILTGTYTDGTPFDFTTCNFYSLYSGVITDTSVLYPYIANTDYLFFEP